MVKKNEVINEEENYDVVYKSKLLNKEFDSLEDLKNAESEFKLEEAKKEEAKLAKKAEALVVNTAIDKYEEGKITCNEIIKAAYDEYKAKVEAAERDLAVLENAATEELNKFLETHPEGFHYTYKSEDGRVVRNYNYYNKRYDVFDAYNKFVDEIKKLWW